MTATTPARQYHTQQVHFFRKSVAFNSPGIGSTGVLVLGTLPANAIVTAAMVKVTTAFNAATTNVLTVGTSATVDAVLSATDIDETVVQTTETFAASGYTVTNDTTLYVKYTQTGTAATAGVAVIILEFIPNIDQ